jgi:CheY-like chemotaxis protein
MKTQKSIRKDARILIIDDDPEDKELFEEAAHELSEEITCLHASNGQEALMILKESAEELPHYIFMDLNMPRFSGKQCLAEIKKEKRFVNIPIVIYTTSKLDTDVEETKKLGASYFLTKPNKFSDLRNVIACILDKNEMGKKEMKDILLPL